MKELYIKNDDNFACEFDMIRKKYTYEIPV
jgi:hypothetical protein